MQNKITIYTYIKMYVEITEPQNHKLGTIREKYLFSWQKLKRQI